jgi:hypothetical protein
VSGSVSAPQSRVPPVSRRGSAALDAVAVAFVVLALLYGRSVTADLEWPGDPDMFRDLAVAQSMHDCRCAADPHYRGELLWYNPLTSGVVAAIAAVTGRPMNLVQVRDGVFLNLLAPFGFYVLAVVLAGRLAAVPALVAFLFLGPGQLFDTATYSPWLMSPNFAQGFFYLALAAYLHAAERRHAGWWISAGVLAGATVLGHTAAAVLFAVIVGVDLVVELTRSESRRRVVAGALLMGTTAALVAAPFLYIVVWHYEGQVLNPVPTVWIDRSMELERWFSFLRAHVWRPVMVPVAIGFVAAMASVLGPRRRRVLAVWSATCVLFLAYSYLWQWQRTKGVTLPTIVPEFHFLRLLDAAEHVWFGIGVYTVVRLLASRVVAPRSREATAIAAVVVVSALATAAAWPRYVQRHDLVAMRTSSQAMYQDQGQLLMYRWIRSFTSTEDVFLADQNVSLAVVAPAGRRVVEVPPFFSNPFVDWGERHNAASSMWSSLTSSNCGGLSELADRYHVTYAIDQSTARWTRTIESACGWTPALVAGDWMVFKRGAR